MSKGIRRILSHDSGAFWQFVKYGVVGVLSTIVQIVVFYILAATVLKCVGADDFLVRHLGFPTDDALTSGVRAFRFAVATAIGFTVSNVFCWLMNRAFVFRAGKFAWWKEFLLFVGVSGLAMLLATGMSAAAIRWLGLMTTYAVIVEIVVSFLFNYFLRKFFIFKG